MRSIAFAVLAAVVCAPLATAQTDTVLDEPTKRALEGVWLMNERPAQGPCVLNRYGNDQIEFEFRKTGGRILFHIPHDIFAAVPITRTERIDGAPTLFVDDGSTSAGRTIRFRLRRDTLEFLPSENQVFKPSAVAYRCGDPDWSVTEGVSTEQLAAVTSPRVISGVGVGPVFVQKLSGASDEEPCDGSSELRGRPGWLYFELFGPVHHHVIGQGFNGRFDLSPIRSIQFVAPGVLKLHLVERALGSDPWGPGVTGNIFEITIKSQGVLIEIPELDMSFVRCRSRSRDDKAQPSPH